MKGALTKLVRSGPSSLCVRPDRLGVESPAPSLDNMVK